MKENDKELIGATSPRNMLVYLESPHRILLPLLPSSSSSSSCYLFTHTVYRVAQIKIPQQ